MGLAQNKIIIPCKPNSIWKAPSLESTSSISSSSHCGYLVIIREICSRVKRFRLRYRILSINTLGFRSSMNGHLVITVPNSVTPTSDNSLRISKKRENWLFDASQLSELCAYKFWQMKFPCRGKFIGLKQRTTNKVHTSTGDIICSTIRSGAMPWFTKWQWANSSLEKVLICNVDNGLKASQAIHY